jgi:hypothetical protein
MQNEKFSRWGSIMGLRKRGNFGGLVGCYGNWKNEFIDYRRLMERS